MTARKNPFYIKEILGVALWILLITILARTGRWDQFREAILPHNREESPSAKLRQ